MQAVSSFVSAVLVPLAAVTEKAYGETRCVCRCLQRSCLESLRPLRAAASITLDAQPRNARQLHVADRVTDRGSAAGNAWGRSVYQLCFVIVLACAILSTLVRWIYCVSKITLNAGPLTCRAASEMSIGMRILRRWMGKDEVSMSR
jgi:hypothetical protein